MKLNQDLMVITLKVLEATELTTTEDIKLVLAGVHYLYLITDGQSWKALGKNPSTNEGDLPHHDQQIDLCLDELLLKTLLALNHSYLIHLGQHNLFKILKVNLIR
jgi:hypothetical protein